MDSSVDPRQMANGPMPAPPTISAPYVKMINAALNIASTRALTFVTLLATIGMFGFAVYDPIPARLYVVATWAGMVLIPMVWALVKKG